QAIWDKKTGSPLLYYSLLQQQLLQEQLGDEYHVALAMRYQNPSIASALNSLKPMNLESLRIIPLFPQYASASTGSVIDKVMALMRTWHTFPAVSVFNDFYDNDAMIDVFVENALTHKPATYDHVLFSYHGLPVRQLTDVEATGTHDCAKAGCREYIDQH